MIKPFTYSGEKPLSCSNCNVTFTIGDKVFPYGRKKKLCVHCAYKRDRELHPEDYPRPKEEEGIQEIDSAKNGKVIKSPRHN